MAGWLQGKRVRPLFGIAWKPLFLEKLVDVRARFGMGDAPESRYGWEGDPRYDFGGSRSEA